MSDKPFDHQARLRLAVQRYQAKRYFDITHLGTAEPHRFPMPTLEPDSPDMNRFDNVIPISKHPRWRWFG